MPRPDITALKILSHTSRSFGENLKIIFFLNSHHLCCSFLSITFPFSPVLNISLSQRESVSQRISENSHTHTHCSSPQPVSVCFALKQSQIPECADVRQHIHCRLRWHLCGCLCFSVFLHASVYLLVWSVLKTCVCVCVCIGELLFMQIFARIFRLLFHRGLLHCFLTLDPAGVCVRGQRSAAAVAIS